MNKQKIYLILDNVRSRENVGSIFRTADGAGVSKIFLCGITPVPKEPKIKNERLCLIHDRVLDTMQEYGMESEKPSDKISKTALGAENYVSWEYRAKTWQVLRELKAKSSKYVSYESGASRPWLKVIGLEQTKNSKNIFELKPKSISSSPLALIVGNEIKGVSPKILKYCDKIVHIPMYGRKESLNVAVATGIALYQIKF